MVQGELQKMSWIITPFMGGVWWLYYQESILGECILKNIFLQNFFFLNKKFCLVLYWNLIKK